MIDTGLSQRILFGLLSAGLLGLVLSMVRRKELELRHGILWLPVAGLALFFSLFPGLLVDIAHALGFQVASNAAMSLAIMGLLFVTFLQSISLARAKADIRDLAQRIALCEAGQKKDR